MIKIIKKLFSPESYKYGVICSACKMAFENLDMHEKHVYNNRLESLHKNKIIHIRSKFK